MKSYTCKTRSVEQTFFPLSLALRRFVDIVEAIFFWGELDDETQEVTGVWTEDLAFVIGVWTDDKESVEPIPCNEAILEQAKSGDCMAFNLELLLNAAIVDWFFRKIKKIFTKFSEKKAKYIMEHDWLFSTLQILSEM